MTKCEIFKVPNKLGMPGDCYLVCLGNVVYAMNEVPLDEEAGACILLTRDMSKTHQVLSHTMVAFAKNATSNAERYKESVVKMVPMAILIKIVNILTSEDSGFRGSGDQQ